MSEQDFLDACERRFRAIEKDLEEIEQRRKQLVNEREAYQRIMSGEQSRLGIAPTALSRPVLGSAKPNGLPMNQTQFIWDEIATGRGVTPRELRELYQKRTGQKPGKSFPYTRLYHMKKKKSAREEGGKYYPVTPQ